MATLRGVGVLVTRPERQALPLCRLLESCGATAVRLPAIDIKPAADVHGLKNRLGALDGFDLIVYTSANAVRFGAVLLDQSLQPTLAAIGPATARALEQAGFRVTVTPVGGFDSESLLSHPQLARGRLRRVLIVKGLHGRELLQQRLVERGALVSIAEVYQRERATHSAADLASLAMSFAAGAVQVVTATSAEVAAALLELATPALRREFDRAHWVVPGARVAAAVRERGVSAPILQADSAEDQDLVAAIVRWRSSVSGA